MALDWNGILEMSIALLIGLIVFELLGMAVSKISEMISSDEFDEDFV